MAAMSVAAVVLFSHLQVIGRSEFFSSSGKGDHRQQTSECKLKENIDIITIINEY
jgi:hypothetical protein